MAHEREVITTDDDGDTAWSIPSAGEQINGPALRLILSVGDDLILIEDMAVTSHAPTFQRLRDGARRSVSLTTEEARWLLGRLPDAIAVRTAQNARDAGEPA